jgi:uncharacterized membrane protein
MGYYQPQDYVIYIGILIVILLVLWKVFQKLKLDKDFVKAIIPYMFVGIFIRVLADTGFFAWDQLWSVTPGVYITSILLASFFIVAGLIAQKYLKISYWIVPFVAGVLITVYLFVQIATYFTHPERMFYPIGLALSITTLVYAVSVLFKQKFLMRLDNLAIIFAHQLDAASTFIAINQYGFYEEHILPGFFISLFGNNAIIMIPIKLLIVALALYYLEEWYSQEGGTTRSKTMYAMAKLLIFIIGIGPGTRNTMLPALNP